MLLFITNACRTIATPEKPEVKTPETKPVFNEALPKSTDSLPKNDDTLKPKTTGVKRVPLQQPTQNKKSTFETQVERTAVDSVVQDMKSKTIFYSGNAVVKYDDI